jgi:hypothetical protein
MRELAKKGGKIRREKRDFGEDKAVDDGLHLTDMAAAVVAAAR